MPDNSAVAFAEISGKFDQMMDKIETVKEKQDEMAADITQIKEAVYNPDQGLYARLRELESWKETSARLLWIVITTLVGLTAATIYKSFF
jgi:septation ring formation regulator EzrA